MNQYFRKPYRNLGGNINFKVDLYNYATKSDFKNATGIDTSKLALKPNLANLRAEIDKINVAKFKTLPADLSKLSNVVNNEVVRKTVYDRLVAKVNNIDTSGFVLKTKYSTNKSDPEKKVSDADKIFLILRDLLKNRCNAKIMEIESKIPSISDLAINSTLIAVENEIPYISNLVKKTTTDFDAKN